MPILGLDIGSSSVKVAILKGTDIVGEVGRESFKTRFDGAKVEVDPNAVLKAIRGAIAQLPKQQVKQVEAVALSVMSPAWVAMEADGKPLTPIVTHQDRRSVEQALAIEAAVGKRRHLKLAGNRPFPGGISSTTFAWYKANEPARLKKVDLVGQLNTFICRQFTGRRAIDPSNASFTGLYETTTLAGWNDELCDAAGVSRHLLPEVLESNRIAGHLSRATALRYGLTEGLPLLIGLVDGSAGMLLAGAKVGQLLNVSGSTDVLAVCVDRPQPHEKLLTRAVGVGRKWLSVSTLAAVGTALNWAREQLFADLSDQAYWKLVGKLAKRKGATRVHFDNRLAGERTSIEQQTASITGLTLATTRQDILAGLVDNLAVTSAARLALLKQPGVKFRKEVVIAGGVGRRLSSVLHRDWQGDWQFTIPPEEATLRGLGVLVE